MVQWRFVDMSDAQLLQWMEANPGRVNDRDSLGMTALYDSADFEEICPTLLWLLDVKGVDVNATTSWGATPLHGADNLPTLIALLDRGADPTLVTPYGTTPLMLQASASGGDVGIVERLLQYLRVRATVNMQDKRGNTVLHYACKSAANVHFLLQTGANPNITNNDGGTPLAWL